MQSEQQKLAQEMQYRMACDAAITEAASRAAGVRLNLGFVTKLRLTTSKPALLIGGG